MDSRPDESGYLVGKRWAAVGRAVTGRRVARAYGLQSARSRSSMEKMSPALMSRLRAKHTRQVHSLLAGQRGMRRMPGSRGERVGNEAASHKGREQGTGNREQGTGSRKAVVATIRNTLVPYLLFPVPCSLGIVTVNGS